MFADVKRLAFDTFFGVCSVDASPTSMGEFVLDRLALLTDCCLLKETMFRKYFNRCQKNYLCGDGVSLLSGVDTDCV